MTKSGHRYLAILIKFLHSFLNTFEYDLLLASLGKEGRQPKMQSKLPIYKSNLMHIHF